MVWTDAFQYNLFQGHRAIIKLLKLNELLQFKIKFLTAFNYTDRIDHKKYVVL